MKREPGYYWAKSKNQTELEIVRYDGWYFHSTINPSAKSTYAFEWISDTLIHEPVNTNK